MKVPNYVMLVSYLSGLGSVGYLVQHTTGSFGVALACVLVARWIFPFSKSTL